MLKRRAAVFMGALALCGAAAPGPLDAFGYDGWSWIELLGVALFAPLFFSISFWFCSAVAGFVWLTWSQDRSLPPLRTPVTRTAVIMPIFNEDAAAVFRRLTAMENSLAELGLANHFDIFVLSDSEDEAIAATEVTEFQRFERGARLQVYYRRRLSRVGRKAGNIADWVTGFGAAYPQTIILDADSLMDGQAMVRLVAMMEDRPDVGIVQTVPRIIGAGTFFQRYIQFGVRLYGRVAAAGLAWWAGEEASYWGHNAIVRTRALAAFGGLPRLAGMGPLSGDIQSHDVVEAALIRRSGMKILVAPEIDGSYEETPPNLVDFALRDRRWCRGNLQHIPLILASGLHWVSRLHLSIGVMAYLASPLWGAFLIVGAIVSVEGVLHGELRPLGSFAWVTLLTATLLFGPKLLGCVHVLMNPRERAEFGGARVVILGALIEMMMSVALAPMLMLSQTRDIFEILIGKNAGWGRQRREASALTTQEALRWCGWHMAVGVAAFLLLVPYPAVALAMMPIIFSMSSAVVIAVLTSRRDVGSVTHALDMLISPEENRPPAIARSVWRDPSAPAAEAAEAIIATVTENAGPQRPSAVRSQS